MTKIANVKTAIILAIAACLVASASPALAESEVLESDIPGYPVGTTIGDETRVIMPDESKMRILIVTTGSTKTLQGPYEGTIPNYKEERSWWERITGRSKETDAPIGATRGILPRNNDNVQQ
ncbi:MAG: hypothetical protein KTR19_07085 [Hyphomicrobiales bacterium]|nr:hypothetical protein [Hyphomicrobiales bacterium]